ncbi:MAG: hypothetical protein AAFQ63_15720 [Cyanobacteria bacterium J06621_11]
MMTTSATRQPLQPVELYIGDDRGNHLNKVMRQGKQPWSKPEPYKFLSGIRYIKPAPVQDRAVSLFGDSGIYLTRADALRATKGVRRNPIDTGDKVRGLAITVADIVAEAHPQGNASWLQPLRVHVSFSSPHASRAVRVAGEKELKKLEKGFVVGGAKYNVEIGEVTCHHEGFLFLEKGVEDCGAVIDFGSGTLQAAHLTDEDKIHPVQISNGDRKGSNPWLGELANQEAVKAQIAKAKKLYGLDIEKMSHNFGNGQFVVEGINLLPALRKTLPQRLTNLANASVQVRTSLKQYGRDDLVGETIYVIGGGAALIAEVATPRQLETLYQKYRVKLWHDAPEYQTVLTMHQLFLQSRPDWQYKTSR